ncbi:MAG: hypothetical protein KJ574_03535 [Nanoarchaeota archaeon]|nr:hypothetical protein [Nanoarchaeota archaeon]
MGEADYKEIPLSTILKYYKRPEIQKAIAAGAKDKEVVGSFGGKGYAKRPDVLLYPGDVLELVKKGITSFHASEEIWRSPLQLDAGMSKKDLDALRKGWDLVIDIDCKFLEYSALAAHLIIEALKFHGIKSVSCKFSGNHGFHIGVPFEAFPDRVHDIPTKDWFPEGPRKIAAYLKHMIKEHLAKEILKIDDIDNIIKKTGKKFEEIVVNGKFDPFTVLELDTILISSRHLYRMQYSFNEKSGLISVPVNPDGILRFKKENAKPELVKVNEFSFLSRDKIINGEATKLLVQAFDFVAEQETRKESAEISQGVFRKKEEFEEIHEAIPETFFPPCIKKMLAGMKDGKKRSLFVLTNFFSSVGWNPEQMEERLLKWNQVNEEPVREVYLKGQLRYHKVQKKKVLPPNCSNRMYYVDMQFCQPDNLCAKIKNPVNYTIRKAKFAQMDTMRNKVIKKK